MLRLDCCPLHLFLLKCLEVCESPSECCLSLGAPPEGEPEKRVRRELGLKEERPGEGSVQTEWREEAGP